ncbi:hypothetical protein QBC37DRAFT_294553 [Rhypophila decipiens]|uniref:Lytic polysaccharide monooxygenase n=1 Tax=Rhypophila decipiens TaxID=261697 RepID=A0AAN6Y1D1_9PEZI|nr:hypothetical protein QBC37DRAFT_294553 [Rhypophila decipiens]
MVVKTTVSVALAAIALFAPLASSHIIMSLPQPYNFKTDPFVQKDPLDGDSFKFPCQGRGHTVDSDITTVVAGGAPMPVTFTGTAAHGGGSCQFSVSYDDPQAAGGWNASSKFKTIYTLIGGCPASSAGNLKDSGTGALDNADGPHCGNDSGKECIREFLIPFPKFLKNGPAVFSWTWHNRVGNHEIYQNCAPIIITGGTEDESEIEALPEIFLGNLPAVQTDVPGYKPCHLGQGQTVNYPNPGKYGRVLEPPTDPEAIPSDYCSDVPPASVIPKFVGDDSAAGAFPTMTPVSNMTNPTPIGSVFLTLPTDGGIPAGDYGPHPTTKGT